MLKPFLTIIFALSASTALGQKKSDTVIYYMKAPSQIVEKAADADYLVQVTPPDNDINSKLFIVKGFYPDGKLMFMTSSLEQNALIYQGSYIGFYPNRKRMVMKQYDHGMIAGDIITYYPNGKIYNVKSVARWGGLLFMQLIDTAGMVIADKGKGRWIVYDDNFKKIYEEGGVHDGLKNGIWKIRINDFVDAQKTFDRGNIIDSKTVYKNKIPDSLHNYTDTIYASVDKNPEYPGGLEEFYKFLAKTLRYPAEAREANIQGRIIVQFVVEKDGALHNLKLMKGIGLGCDEEAIRTIQLSSPWISGIKNGTSVRCAYTVPIQFTLSQ